MTVGQGAQSGQELPSFVIVAAPASAPCPGPTGEGAADEGETAFGSAAEETVGGAGLISAATVPPKIVTPPSTASVTIPAATSELVLTDTGGSIQS
ncbi:MAG TPA: hypothetical protein VGP64_06900, partial [Polyangia bacterium]